MEEMLLLPPPPIIFNSVQERKICEVWLSFVAVSAHFKERKTLHKFWGFFGWGDVS